MVRTTYKQTDKKPWDEFGHSIETLQANGDLESNHFTFYDVCDPNLKNGAIPSKLSEKYHAPNYSNALMCWRP